MKPIAAALWLTLAASIQAGGPVKLERGDTIVFEGNALADRMQHHGWLETLIHARFPNHELTIRNCGFAGDEVTVHLRSAGFKGGGQPHHAEVVFSFYGYNESFASPEKFKSDLEQWVLKTIDHGVKSPRGRMVLFSPIAHENLKNPNLPDGVANNKRLAAITAAMADVARKCDVGFVDLFTISQRLYAASTKPLTINGIHLDEHGDELVARAAVEFMFGPGNPPADKLARLHGAVNEKNFYWFQRYRTTDGYSIYGGRADLKFVNDQTNRVVADREMEVLDVMTRNRDAYVWKIAAGYDPDPVDDSNTPPFIPVKTNKPGSGPNGAHVFLSGNESVALMKVHPKMKVNLFASEEMFPELVNPVQMTWDARGRLWVAVWPSYPHWKPKEEMNDKILILEDTTGDGVADKCTVFADKLNNPTGFELTADGVYVAQAPDLMHLRDTKGTGKADYRERVLHGLDSADTHHTANSFALDPSGAIYFQEGTFHHTQVETPYGPPVRNINAGVYRYEPRTQKFDVYVAHGFANPHGHAFDRWGQDIVVDGTGSQPYHAALFSGHMNFPMKHHTPPSVYKQRTRPCPGIEFVSSNHFPPEMQGNMLVGNVIGFQGILQYRIEDDGASFKGTEVEPILSSTDPNFRPSDMKIGPDGALYFIDWHNPIIGHMQHNLRDPSRDRTHGRVYRVTYVGRPLNSPVAIAGQSIESLLDLLKASENRVRTRARLELGGRDASEVLPAAERWLSRLDANDREFEHHRLEVLWLFQNHNVANSTLLNAVLASPDFRARAAAAHVLCQWRDRVPESLGIFKKLAADSHPRVRLEAIRAASFFTEPDAIEVALIAAELPNDQFLDFVRGETMRTLAPYWRAAVTKGDKIAFTTELGPKFLLRNMALNQLLKQPKTRSVVHEMLFRPELPDDDRRSAIKLLAQMDKVSESAAIVAALARLDNATDMRDANLAYLLTRQLAGRDGKELASIRGDIEKLAIAGRQATLRQMCFAAMIALDGNAESAWSIAKAAPRRLGDLVAAVPFVGDPGVRSALYPRVEPLLNKAGMRHAAMAAMVSMRGHEAESFSSIARFLENDEERMPTIRAIQRIPQNHWPKEAAPRLVEMLLERLRKMPAEKRTSTDALDLMEFCQSLAALLPADAARGVRQELRGLGVAVIRLGTLPERMAYDKDLLVVQAGKPFEIVLRNDDMMPHNFVLAKPGSLEALGMYSEDNATDPAFAQRQFVPKASTVLLASKLIQPRDTQKLSFTAPATPGVFPYVCTYPGHWRRMNGAMYVVADLDAYQADPVAYLASHPISILDPLLKDRRPRTEWTFAELSPSMGHVRSGRNFAVGKQMFSIANCVACHKLEGVGKEFGPDLTKIDAKNFDPSVMLRNLLEPSLQIDDKYASHRFQLSNGKVITGLILDESADSVRVVENPLVSAEAAIVKKADVELREKSPVSLMPKGLLDKLTHDEILDLLAYVIAKGDKNHPAFNAGGQGH